MDYKALLEKYVRLVIGREGFSFVEGWQREPDYRDGEIDVTPRHFGAETSFSRKEWEELGHIADAAMAEAYPDEDGDE